MPASLPLRPLGRTGLQVSALGLGAGQIGDPALDEREVAALVDGALDLGINVIDAARSYGCAEERLGRLLRGRRDDVVLSTKVGYGIAGVPDWTAEAVARGIDEALVRLGTDVLDIVHLHSCAADVLSAGDVVAPLEDAVRAGKVRVAAYSGDNRDLDVALGLGVFGVVQTSLNLCDQRAARVMDRARRAGVAIIAKRPVANAPWRFDARPVGDECEPYWLRWRGLGYDPGDVPWDELAIRFAAHFPGVATAVVGTRRLAHLRRNAEHVARGPLPDERFLHVRDRFNERGYAWPGRV
ncbi:MAG: aldo/keto reductase [Kofleriaceae bacterium]|nr:aldo/keto reductase [Myxococcales bacterium]MCB9559941.1 aldo/keto reductase [Kofleriaceae bacterium]MCB9571556.1 aldo/keto reductase [Kofleriaceae bacterium]